MNLSDFHLVCVTESELIQWRARGLMHIASERILRSESDKRALFALAPLTKHDDAKAHVVVRLNEGWGASTSIHPVLADPRVLSLKWSEIIGLAPALPQWRSRLEGYGVKVENWDLSQAWEAWLLPQACYERVNAIQDELGKLGFNAADFLKNTDLLMQVVRAAIRPNLKFESESKLPNGWTRLLQNRDPILKQLRFDGHSDRLSFLAACLRELANDNVIAKVSGDLGPLLTDRDSGWLLSDLTPAVIELICKSADSSKGSLGEHLHPLIGAIYLRVYDELFYGQRDWSICFNLLRYAKYSIDSIGADFLTTAILGSFPAEEIRALDLRSKFDRLL